MSDVPTENAISRAEAAQQSGDFDAAEQALRNLLELDADHLMARNNLAALVARRGDAAAAVDILDELIAEEPGYSSAHFNRANALLALGRNEDAIAAFRAVTALEPDHIDAHRALAFQWLSRGDRDRAMDHFARTYDLRRGEGRTGVAERSLRTASAAKLKHDSDLFRNLPPRVRDGHKFETLARIYDSVAADLGRLEPVEELLEERGGRRRRRLVLERAHGLGLLHAGREDGVAGLVRRLQAQLPGAALVGRGPELGCRRQRVGAVREVDEDGRGDSGHGACCVGACCAAALACATTGGRRREISEMTSRRSTPPPKLKQAFVQTDRTGCPGRKGCLCDGSGPMLL
mgnify:CR=1 FL=1